MGQVVLTINGKPYSVTCGDGEDERIRKLGQYIDAKVADFARTLGQIGDARLLVLTALVLADELAEAREAAIRARRASIAAAVPSETQRDSAAEDVVASGIDSLAARVEAIASRLEAAHLKER